MGRKFKCALVLMMLLMFYGTSYAVIRNGSIQGKAGLSYGFMGYTFNTVELTITNRNSHSITFGGTMIFLDKNYRVVARADLMSAVIKRRSSRRYRAHFSEGSGETAKAAKYIRWEF